MKQIGLLAFLVIVFLTPSLGQKSGSLTEKDKSRLVEMILRNYNFTKDSASWKENEINTIHLLAEGVSETQLPVIRNVRFILVTKDEVGKLDKTVADYYELGKFEVKGKTVQVMFSRLYLHPVNGDGTVTWYECRKAGGKWWVKEIRTMEFADSKS